MSQAPLVVVVVVACDPGNYLEECLRSIEASNYPNLKVIVVDNHSEVDVERTFGHILPNVVFLRTEKRLFYSQAANLGASSVEEGTHLLFLHDDTALETTAISSMMEVAYLKNASVVTPKFMVWDTPSKILQLGLDLDRTGATSSRVDVGDEDQEQYDTIEEVAVAPGGAILVRHDLFVALDGFDERIRIVGEDLDFSWRVQLIGGRIFTAPSARVRHLMVSTLAPVRPRYLRASLINSNLGRPGLGRATYLRYARRHQLRVILKDYLGRGRLRALLLFVVLALLEALFYLGTGHPRYAVAVLSAFQWNLGNRRERTQKRRVLRRLVHGDVRPVQFRAGSAKISTFLDRRRERRRLELLAVGQNYGLDAEGENAAELIAGDLSTSRLEKALSSVLRLMTILISLAILLIAWSVFFGPLPLLGTMAGIPDPLTLLSAFFHGRYGSLSYGPSPAPTSFLLFGVLGFIMGNSGGFLAHFLIVLAIVGGGFGVYRLVRENGSKVAGQLAAILYLLSPLLVGAMRSANFFEILGFGLTPWLILTYRRGAASVRASRRVMRRANIKLGLLAGLTLAVSPALFIIFLAFGLIEVVISLVLKERGGARRNLYSIVVAIVLSVLFNLPWAISLLNPTVGLARLYGGAAPKGLSFLEVALFQGGSVGATAYLFLGVYLFAVLGLFFSASDRVRLLGRRLLLLGALLLLAELDTLGVFGGSPAPLWAFYLFAGLTLIEAACFAVDSLLRDLSSFRFSLRHVVAVLSAGVLALCTIGSLAVLHNSRLGMPSSGYGTSLGSIGSLPVDQNVLWMGDPAILPVGGWKLTNGLSLSLSSRAVPDFRDLYVPNSYAGVSPVFEAIRSAVAGDTVQLGRKLASYGIRYIVLPQPNSTPGYFTGTDLDVVLERQVDLRQLLVDPSVIAYEVNSHVTDLVNRSSQFEDVLRVGGALVEILAIGAYSLALVRRRSILLMLRAPRPWLRLSSRDRSSRKAARGSGAADLSVESPQKTSELNPVVEVLNEHSDVKQLESVIDGRVDPPQRDVEEVSPDQPALATPEQEDHQSTTPEVETLLPSPASPKRSSTRRKRASEQEPLVQAIPEESQEPSSDGSKGSVEPTVPPVPTKRRRTSRSSLSDESPAEVGTPSLFEEREE